MRQSGTGRETVLSRNCADISRKMKMDLKTLKDLRHDNLNSFIGACVEPATISVVTDYGTRGSLRCTRASPTRTLFVCLFVC